MKPGKKFFFIVLALFVCTSATFLFSQEADEEEEPALPNSVEMNLEITNQEGLMPEGFRNSEEGDGDLQWLEDVGILMAENSDLYNVDADAIAENAKFDSEPNINWEVKKENNEGDYDSIDSDNTNKATNESNITTPGYYQVHNGGARLVSTESESDEDPEGSDGSNDDTTTVDSDGDPISGGSLTTTGGEDGEDGDDAEGQSQTVTSQQRIGIKVHDCTAPDLWVAFEEGAGRNVDMSETEAELKEKMAKQILENLGRPLSLDPEFYEKASYIFLEEGNEDERNSIPWEKTARLSIAGPLFNEKGISKVESGTLPAKMDEKEYTNHINVVGGEGKNLKGVFVRRNVPFIFAVVSTDNCNERVTPLGDTEGTIEYADGGEVEKDGEGYLFRVPNYPREQYDDQPEYVFIATANDNEGNVTSIRMPLYVVDTAAAFEGSTNR
jgi:hypothetical protein